LGLQQTSKALLGVGERTVQGLISAPAFVKFPSERLMSHVGISLTERQWKKFGIATAIFLCVFPFVAPRTGYFKGIQFAPLFLILGVIFELLAFFMDVNYSLSEEEDLSLTGWVGLRPLQPGDLFITALVISYLSLLVG